MNREILFRGKSVDTGEWVEGSLVHETDFYGIPVDRYYILQGGQFDYDLYDSVEVYPETVGQYTGFYDKNDKKIFEGDIVRGMLDYGPGGYLEGTTVVRFHAINGWQFNYFEDIDLIEVVGNEWDNPELLGR